MFWLAASPVRQCSSLLDTLSSCQIQVEELSFHYSANEPPHIRNDIITINRWQASDHQVKLSISLALAQSCVLAVYEERIGLLVEEASGPLNDHHPALFGCSPAALVCEATA